MIFRGTKIMQEYYLAKKIIFLYKLFAFEEDEVSV